MLIEERPEPDSPSYQGEPVRRPDGDVTKSSVKRHGQNA